MKMRVIASLALCFVAVAAIPAKRPRIVGGSLTSIDKYPSMTSVLHLWEGGSMYVQFCGGTVINHRSVMSAAHCYHDLVIPNRWRVRVGSTFANSGGTVFDLEQIIIHPEFEGVNYDICFLRVIGDMSLIKEVRPARIPGPDYNLPDNAEVWATGFGGTYSGGPASERLREVQVWTISQEICEERYGGYIPMTMLCSGWFDVGLKDQCVGDSGGPLYHDGDVVVGICSWGGECASPIYPGVNARVNYFHDWIELNK